MQNPMINIFLYFIIQNISKVFPIQVERDTVSICEILGSES